MPADRPAPRDAPRPARSRAGLARLALFAGLALSLTSLHGYIINYGDKADKRDDRHARIVSLEGESPWAYRVAVPFVAEGVQRALAPLPIPPKDAREGGYLAVRFLALWFTLVAVERVARRFVAPGYALAAALWLAALHGPSFQHYWFSPDSPVDLALWAGAVWLSLAGRGWALVPLVFLGSINRETAVFVAPLHLALRFGEEPLKPLLARCAAIGAAWALPFLALRELVQVEGWARGKTVIDYLGNNLGRPEWMLYAAVFVLPWLILPLIGWARVPPPLRRAMIGLSPYLALILLFGRVREVRLFLPLAVAFLPAAAVVLQRWTDDDEVAGA
jgi:hypothetical protein